MGYACICKSRSVSGGDTVDGISIESVKPIYKARVIGAPVETGQTSFDNKVIDPYEVIVTGTIEIDADGYWRKTVSELKEMFQNRDFSFYSVSDGVNYYEDLIMTELPFTRDVEKFDWYTFDIKFTQAMLVQSSQSKARNAENSDTRNLGYTSPVTS